MLDEAFGILREIQARGRLAVIVGGAVRDLLLDRPVTDVDLATDMPLHELASLFTTHAVGRSEQFDTVVVVRGGHAFEISRFRGGDAARGEPTAGARSPEKLELLRADTAHRDFTVNALVLGLDGAVVDLQGGRADLQARIVRCVGSPDERFAEDPARVLRAVRFAACLGFTIEAGTAAAIARHAPRLAEVAGERIGKEIQKLAAQPGAALADGIGLLDRFAMLGLLLPEVRELQGLPQPAEWHPEGDAWEHTLAALRASPATDPTVNLAILLHDVGKHPAHREAEGGRHHYRGHESAGAGLATSIARRLHLTQGQRAGIAFAVAEHMRAGRFAELRRSKRFALLSDERWPILRALALCDLAARGDGAAVARLESAFREAEVDFGSPAARAGAPVITGTRIMELTGIAPGPRLGEIQRRVGEWALDNRIEDAARIEAEAVRLAAPGTPP